MKVVVNYSDEENRYADEDFPQIPREGDQINRSADGKFVGHYHVSKVSWLVGDYDEVAVIDAERKHYHE